ncbi:MAG: 3D-(3,5/4)-trihydroxycyclohexane-1,2-dione acylhydrolase (decyclizing), partial [Rhodospirillales bacterium]|nr:3D-(3,5/4)-trihydroxycyclohexane-1,2-dione acylhydrolase (decyclizing) [Rhodospirillales bacterium]
MTTIRLTAAQALVRYLAAQRTEIDGAELPIFAGVWAIFGHGNVAAMGEALHAAGDALPTYRGHNEQGMALAAIAYAKA